MGRLIDADTCQYYDGYGDRLDRAIEIVKRGGRDDFKRNLQSCLRITV